MISDEELERAVGSKRAMCRLYPYILKRYMAVHNREQFDVFIAKVLKEAKAKDELITGLREEASKVMPLKAQCIELQQRLDVLEKKYLVVSRELQFRARNDAYSVAG